MHNYRDIHEYHDPCYYCKCDKCLIESCQLNKCNFCEGGKGCATENCKKFISKEVIIYAEDTPKEMTLKEYKEMNEYKDLF